jgi:hypothetical protein
MTITSFAERWQQKQRDLGLEEVSDGLVVNGTWVLPASAAPFLTFAELSQMPRVQDVFNLEGWPEEELAKLEPYRMIGSDGAGNPICVERETGLIWLLDHDVLFQTRQFVNSSIGQLAESLLAYLGEDAPERVLATIAAEDPRAMNEGAFWWHEVNSL